MCNHHILQLIIAFEQRNSLFKISPLSAHYQNTPINTTKTRKHPILHRHPPHSPQNTPKTHPFTPHHPITSLTEQEGRQGRGGRAGREGEGGSLSPPPPAEPHGRCHCLTRNPRGAIKHCPGGEHPQPCPGGDGEAVERRGDGEVRGLTLGGYFMMEMGSDGRRWGD